MRARWHVPHPIYAGEAFFRVGRFSLCPPVQRFEAVNPHLARDYRHKQVNQDDERLNKLIKRSGNQDATYRASPGHCSYAIKRRNQQIMALLTQGFTVIEVAAQMNVTRAVVNHAKRIAETKPCPEFHSPRLSPSKLTP